MIQVTGEPDTGKTSFALQSGAMPSEMVFIDADVKGRATVAQIKAASHEFGMYVDLVAETDGMREIEYHDHCITLFQDIAELPEEKRRVIVWDTWEPFEKTFKPVVSRNPKKFREFYSSMGTIKGAEEWLASFDYEAGLISQLTEICELLILVSHVKNYNISGKRVAGKFVSDNKKPVVQKAFMRLWLRHNPDSDVPIGLVLKRLGRTVVKEGTGVRTMNVLPRKIKPSDEDESLWDTIKRYWDEPIGKREREEGEVPNDFEMSILEGTLTDDQRMAFRAAVQQGKEEDSIFEAEADELREQAVGLKAEGKTLPVIAKTMNVPIGKVAELLKDS